MSQLATLDTLKIPAAAAAISVGFAKVNLTPHFPASITAYGKRKAVQFKSVRDSIYVRALVMDNGREKVAIVSADLLLIPPTVVDRLKAKLPLINFTLDNVYLGATHTHNSIGNWGEGAAGLFYGKYDEKMVDHIANKIVNCISLASQSMEKATLKSGAIPIPAAVGNRLIKGGPEDSLFRVVEIHRNDSSKLLLTSFTAHATCLYSNDVALSRDYPGALVIE